MGISRSERNRLNIDTDDFIYGEIEFSSFSNILDRVQPRSNEIFYDLGCGAGKAVLSAAMNFDLSKIVGIELLPGLCQLANEKIQYARSLVGNDHFYLKKLSNIKIINDNLNHCDISESDIVFVNATCFGYTAWKKIQEKFLSLKIGSRVIVTTQSIDDDRFLYLSQRFELMSWGINSVNTYKKIK
jgi:precorrin-6B methylase 2